MAMIELGNNDAGASWKRFYDVVSKATVFRQ
jgi:hypothetical protein